MSTRWTPASSARARLRAPSCGSLVQWLLVVCAEDPRASTSLRRLTGRPETRLRVGDWRVLLIVDVEDRVILVMRILPRGRAYDN
jgi:mRNA interferase RelE/StbE